MDQQKPLTEGERSAMHAAIEAGVAHDMRTRRLRVRIATSGVAIVIVAALAGIAAWGIGMRAAPSPITSASPTPTRTPSPSPSPTSTPPAPTSTPDTGQPGPSEWIVSEAGIGPFLLGMDFDAAVAALPGATSCRPDDTESTYSAQEPPVWLLRSSSDARAELGAVVWDWTSQTATADLTLAPRTAEGIGLGSTVAEVRAAYPAAVSTRRNTEFLEFGRIFVAVPEGYVTAIGVSDGGAPWEYCG